ncbi:MAG: HPP family protein [Alphaproteobacteria bacterium]|nr:HPP family protein [Alphaproteobacteria bacterium]
MPRSLFGGHLIASLIGLAFPHVGQTRFDDPAEAWMIAAVAVTLAAMMASRTLHSPAGANPVVIFLEHADWWFLAWPLLVGLVVLFTAQVVFERGMPARGAHGPD